MRKNSRKHIDKKRAQRIHAKRRFQERLGLPMTTRSLEEIVLLIKTNRAKLYKRQSNRVTLWDLNFNDQSIRVVYDSRTKNIVTVMLNEVEPQKEIPNAQPTAI